MVKRDEIVNFLNNYLEVGKIKDNSINGIQVSGKNEIKKIVVGVSASLELFRKAFKRKADMIVVHHGMFWEGDIPLIKHVMKKRIKYLLDNDITLLAYHLPLDKHPKIGNNIQLLKKLDLKLSGEFGKYKDQYVGFIGKSKSINIKDFVKKVNDILNTQSEVYNYGPKNVKYIGIVSGHGVISDISEAFDKNIDTILTGDPEEHIPHLAKEGEINIIFAGHYNSEKLGIQALGELLKKKFKIDVEFIDVPCNV